MPVLNGFETSTCIRKLEMQYERTDAPARVSKILNGRVPIFAVSASLKENQRNDIILSGMDGWFLKPVNFKRLRELLSGILNQEQRKANTYRPGCKWENGGWLAKDDILKKSE